MDLLTREAEVADGGGRRRMFPPGTFAPGTGSLAPGLRGVVFVRQPALRPSLDFERVGLGLVRGGGDRPERPF